MSVDEEITQGTRRHCQLGGMTWTPRVIHNPNYGVVTEKTDQGQQIVLPGTERSALQAAKERGEKMRPKKPQADPGPLFEAREKRPPDLFGEPK